MDLQFSHRTRFVPPPTTGAPYGRMHLVRDGFLYAGLIFGVSSQRHSALIYLSLGSDTFSIETPDEQVRASAALVAPGVHKSFDGGDAPVVLIDVCPTHRHYRALAQAGSGTQVWPRDHFDGFADALRAFHDRSMCIAEADQLFRALLDHAVRLVPAVQPLDPRVREVMRLLRENRGHSLRELADAVGLSKDWLVQLFQREAGITLRKYEQTLKIQTAASYVKRGVSLTEVAAIAGFADSAHFSKLWKQHYGFPPMQLFTANELMTVDPLPWPSCIDAPGSAERGRAALQD